MAIEASSHHTLFPPQLLLNNQMMMIDAINNQSNPNTYNGNNHHFRYGITHPLSGTTTAETLLPMYSGHTDSINPDPLNSDSGLTYSLPVSRKRPRDSGSRNPIDRPATFMFLGEDISAQIQQQQLEIDQFVAQHTEKVRVEIEERRRKNSRTIIAALEEGLTQRLQAKQDQIIKMSKLNHALEEKLKSLSIENQIWRELAHTNESTANTLRHHLKQVLEQVIINTDYRDNRITTTREDHAPVEVDDAQSCCESNNENERTLVEQDSCNSNMKSNRLCKSCWKAESCVLLLPCRHLCLCTVCASSVNICPICKSAKNISVHVHMS